MFVFPLAKVERITALRYLGRHPCALSSATPRNMSDYDEFCFYVTILLIRSPSRIPRLPIRGPLQYIYGRHVICALDGTEFLGTSHTVDFHSGLPISTTCWVFQNTT